MSPAAKKPAATTKAATKKPAATKANTPDRAAKASAADLARRTIEKKTGQKAVTASFSTYPHVPSGSDAINDLIGGSMALDGKGRVCPGYPRKRISELYGPESSGKTTVALHAITEAQQAGGLAMFLDFEHALDHAYAKKIGVSFDADKLLLYAPNTFEEGIAIINIGIQAGVDIIVVDSVPSMVPKEDMEGKLDKEGRFGSLARAMAKNLPKLAAWLNNEEYLVRNPEGTAVIFLNQERANIGASPGRGDKTKTTGGYAMKFYTSLRLKFNGIGRETIKRRNKFTGVEVSVPYGVKTQVKVVKNKIDAKQGQTHVIFLRYGQGIDELYSLIEAATYHKVVRKAGSTYQFEDDIKIVGREKFRKFLKDNPTVASKIRHHLVSVIQGEAEDMEEEEELTEAQVMERSFEEALEEDPSPKDSDNEDELVEEDLGGDPETDGGEEADGGDD